jgi:TolB-like protein/DNA-binding winged helix-turn-helix (wHTH) protein/Tfp pilus assembly protein PilF
MDSNSNHRGRFRFGVFELDTVCGELYKHGMRIKLQAQPFQVLSMLVERPGKVVTREELRNSLWSHDTYVDFDHSLNISINKLREALGDSRTTPRFIETLPRRGYRFLAPVSTSEPAAPAVPVPPTSVAAAPLAETKSADENVEIKPTTPRRRVWIGLAVLALLALVAVGLWRWRETRPGSGGGRVMLAVLPFEDLTTDQHQDYFVAGLHDELIAQLARLHPSRLGVIARTSMIQYASNRKPVDQIGRELGVNYVLDGTVRRLGDRFRITAELIQVSDQTHLWTETYEPSMSDMLALQEDVAQRVSQALTIEFLPQAEQQLRRNATANAAAYEAYLRGRFLWHQETRSSLEQALVEFQTANQLDPGYAPAYVGLADTYGVLGGYGFVPADDAFRKGKVAAAKALELAPNLSDAYGTLAFINFYYDWNWSESERLFRQALSDNPNNAVAREFYCSFLHAMGRLDEAEAENRVAKELDPLNGWLYDDKGWMLLTRRRPDLAIAEFQKAIELNPKFPAAHLSLAVAYNRTGQFANAFAEVQKAEQMGGDPTRVLEILGSTQALSGDLKAAQATVDKLRAGDISGRISPYSVALIYTAMGRKVDALDWLEKGYREKETWMPWIKVLVEWDSLRSEPRFADLLSRLNLKG